MHTAFFFLSHFFSFGSVRESAESAKPQEKGPENMGQARDLKMQLVGDTVNKLCYIHIAQCTFC